MLNNIEVLSRVILEDASSEAGAILDNAKKEAESIKIKNSKIVDNLLKNPKNIKSGWIY